MSECCNSVNRSAIGECQRRKPLLFFFFLFCVPELYHWGSPFWVNYFANVTFFFNPAIEVVTFRLVDALLLLSISPPELPPSHHHHHNHHLTTYHYYLFISDIIFIIVLISLLPLISLLLPVPVLLCYKHKKNCLLLPSNILFARACTRTCVRACVRA